MSSSYIRMRLTFISIVLSLLIVIPGTGNSQEAPAQQPTAGGWLVMRLSAEPATLNPITATDAYESRINGFIYESLLERDNRTLNLVPLLAESWNASEDKLSYEFSLRPGLKWQDGRPLTTEDVVFTFEMAKDPSVDAPHLRNYVKDLEKIEALDLRTVRFTFSKPYFKSLEIVSGLKIIPKHIFSEGDFNTHPAGRNPMGSGPYVFEKWDTGKEIVLKRNQDYWGSKPFLDRIHFKIITDNTVALQVFKRGELDYMGLTPIQWVRQTKTSKFRQATDKHRYYSPGYSYVGWNMKKPYFSDKRVRRAMTMLVERDSILENIRYGLGKVVTGNFFYESPDYDKSIEPWPYDPKVAAKLLGEAGWTDSDGDGIRDKDGVPFKFEFTISSGSDFAEKLSTILKEELSKVGIEMTIRPLEWALFTKTLDDRTYDAVTLGWSLPVEADPYQVWHSSQAEEGSNFVGFVNEEADDLIEEARVTFDKDERMKMYRRFHGIMHEEQPYTFLFISENLVALDKRFENVVVYPLGLDPTEWWVPEEKRKYK